MTVEKVSPRVLILVCSFNEAGNLPTLFEQLRLHSPTADVLLIDDGSDDGTHEWLRGNQQGWPWLTVINRGNKQGLGTAIRDGLLYAIEQDYELCINLDADLSHDPVELPKLLQAAQAGADLVIGSRYVSGGGFADCSWRRIWVSKTVNALARKLIGWPIRDCSSAYRCYRIAAIEDLQLSQINNASYGFLEEVLHRLWRPDAKIVEVPIVYTERQHGHSKISFREARLTLATLLKLARRR